MGVPEDQSRLGVPPAILFDLDNTLICTRRADTAACNKLISILSGQYGMPEEDALATTTSYLRSFRRCPDNPEYELDTWRNLLWNEALGEDYCHIANDVYVQWLELRYHYLAINPEILSLLVSLRKHYLLGLITNGPSRAQWEKIDRLELKNYFDCILVSGDLPWEKPDQQIFHQACQLLGVEPKNCIMVGDKLETDIQGGKEAELGGTVWIPLNPEEDTASVTPDFTIDDVTQLPDILSENTLWTDCCKYVRDDDNSNDFSIMTDDSSMDSHMKEEENTNDSHMMEDDSNTGFS